MFTVCGWEVGGWGSREKGEENLGTQGVGRQY